MTETKNEAQKTKKWDMISHKSDEEKFFDFLNQSQSII